MLKYKTILFDLDGTLIDTNELILTTFLHVLEEHFPGKFKREDLIPHMGETLYLQMERYGGIDKRDLLVKAYREYNEAIHDEYVKEFPYVIETLEELDKLGIRMGIVTSKQRKTAEMGVKLFGMDRFIRAFVTYDDVVQHKPHPEPVLRGMELLQADPEFTLMVGDSHFDIKAAHHAGIHAAAVAWSMKGVDYLRSFHPEYLIDDFRELISIVRGE